MGEIRYNIGQLAELTGLTRRTIRYYVHEGLIGGPTGETKAAYYTQRQLDDLLEVKRLATEGYRLGRIGEIMSARRMEDEELPQPGKDDLALWTEISVTEGVRIQVRGDIKKISTEDLRTFLGKVADAYREIIQHREE